MPKSQITILANDQITKVTTYRKNNDALWMKAAELKGATRFELKKSGADKHHGDGGVGWTGMRYEGGRDRAGAGGGCSGPHRSGAD